MGARDKKNNLRIKAGLRGVPEHTPIIMENVSTYFLLTNTKCSTFKKYTPQLIQTRLSELIIGKMELLKTLKPRDPKRPQKRITERT